MHQSSGVLIISLETDEDLDLRFGRGRAGARFSGGSFSFREEDSNLGLKFGISGRSFDLRAEVFPPRVEVYALGSKFRFSGTCFLDRKSTRLNSSHVSISYAV